MNQASAQVVILGGGIIGLSTARSLAQAGYQVCVVERDALGSHASSAAAGILARRAVEHSGVPGREFYTRSLLEYPQWVAEVAAEAKLPVDLFEGDDWCLYCHGGRADRFQQRLERESNPSEWQETGLPSELEGLVKPRLWRVFRFRNERWLRPAQLLQALEASARGLGICLLDRGGQWSLSRQEGGGFCVSNGTHAIETPIVIVTAGPWSTPLLESLGWEANTVPVRGQVALVPRLHGLEAMLHLEDTFYVVPRGESSLVGATIEHGVWSEETSPEGIAELQSRLQALIPTLDLSKATQTWAGLRPRTRDRVPHLGWLEPGLMVASGHYRSGLSMAPLSGKAVVALLSGGDLPGGLGDLDPLRRPGGYRQTLKF